MNGLLKRGQIIVRMLWWLSLLVILAGLCRTLAVSAEDLKGASTQLAERSFALLDTLSKQDSSAPKPLLGPVASFAGDADGLRQSLARDDLRSAKSAMAALQADGNGIDQTLQQHPDAVTAEQWRSLKQQAGQLAREMPPCNADCLAPVPASPAGAGLAKGTTPNGDAPRIVIASRESGGSTVRLKGYFEGRRLKSAGLYQGSEELKAFKVAGVTGRQRVEFDLRLEDPSPATNLRVSDLDDRTAEIPVLDSSATAPAAAEMSAASPPPVPFNDSGGPAKETSGNASTVEIPSHGPLLPSPSKRHTLGSNLGEVRINVLRVIRVGNLPPTYDLTGQIEGRGITRAGIYLNGRPLRRIPVLHGSNHTSFHQRVAVQAGSMTIRAYSVGNQFVEQSVDLFSAEDAAELPDDGGGSMVMAMPMRAAGAAVQITGIRPLAGGLYLVSGTISGPDVVSAGLYQNGVLAQNISANGGLAGALGALLAGSARSITFNVRVNPYAGPASIRVFDSTGAFTEQPIAIAGVAPYGNTLSGPFYRGPATVPFTGPPASPYQRFGSGRLPW